VAHISLVFREIWDTTALSLWLPTHPMHFAVNVRGIPYLAKNERDMGHPSFVKEQEVLRQALWPTRYRLPAWRRLYRTTEAVLFV
jgi:hypothetical protein